MPAVRIGTEIASRSEARTCAIETNSRCFYMTFQFRDHPADCSFMRTSGGRRWPTQSALRCSPERSRDQRWMLRTCGACSATDVRRRPCSRRWKATWVLPPGTGIRRAMTRCRFGRWVQFPACKAKASGRPCCSSSSRVPRTCSPLRRNRSIPRRSRDAPPLCAHCAGRTGAAGRRSRDSAQAVCRGAWTRLAIASRPVVTLLS